MLMNIIRSVLPFPSFEIISSNDKIIRSLFKALLSKASKLNYIHRYSYVVIVCLLRCVEAYIAIPRTPFRANKTTVSL